MLSKIADKKYQLLGISALFLGIAAGSYFFYKNKTNKQNKQKNQININDHGQLLNQSKVHSQINNESSQKWSSLYSQFYFDKNLQSRKVIDHLEIQGISVQTIYKYSPLIAVDQYKKFTSEIRRRRRLIRTVNQDQYIRLILEYEQQVDQLLQRSRQQIVYECEIDPDEFSNMKVIFEATQDLNALIRDAKKYLKQLGLNRKRNICKVTIQKIINQQISFIKSKLYERLRNKLQNDLNLCQDQIFKIIQALIDDIVYQKYGYERQQIQHSLNTQWKVQLSKQIKELKKNRSQLESDIGNINLLSQQSDAQSQKDRNPLSQGLTRSGANSSFIEDQEICD